MVDSKKARKQRKALYNAPNHVRSAMVSSHLDDPLRKEYKLRSVRVIKGDTVKIMRGDEDIVGHEGKVQEVDTKTGRITVEGVTVAKADGTQTARKVHSSKVLITRLDLTDARRKDKLTKAKEVSQ
jgi:large subunit ribosomal protein L24